MARNKLRNLDLAAVRSEELMLSRDEVERFKRMGRAGLLAYLKENPVKSELYILVDSIGRRRRCNFKATMNGDPEIRAAYELGMRWLPAECQKGLPGSFEDEGERTTSLPRRVKDLPLVGKLAYGLYGIALEHTTADEIQERLEEGRIPISES